MKPEEPLFTRHEKELLRGLAGRVGDKNNCSGMYVRHIIQGNRRTETVLANAIIKDLRALLETLHPPP